MVGVVIPCYKCKKHIVEVLAKIGSEVDKIYIIDDCCPERTGQFVEQTVKDDRVQVIYNEVNLGVGGAVVAGYLRAQREGCTVVVKLDGDGQMDPSMIQRFINPILRGYADYTKGNRFNQIDYLADMPPIRIFGNAVLSFFTKLSSGYWTLFDPTNGYTAIHTAILDQVGLEKLHKRYFFESDILFRLNICRAVVVDIPMPAKYGEEVSGLNELRIIPTFIWGHVKNFCKRISYNYFLRNFSLASLQFIMGILLLFFGIVYGGFQWWHSYILEVTTPSGKVMMAALPVILGIQFLLSFFGYDISSMPQFPLHKKIQ
ncbi:MAG TPA: glycosyltransferase [Pseudobdellovibrionaceae bacterium]|jgi:glycosyltransferase involved in cell wall biosynthesis